MKRFYPIVYMLSMLTLSSCGERDRGSSQGENQPKPFQVTEIPTQNVTSYKTYPASIEGIVNSEVRAKITGYITDVLVDEGQEVRKGEVLFKLETQSLSQDAEAAKANVNAAQVEVDKLKPLVDKGIISNVQLETAKAQLQQAQSSYNSVVANINYANIKSPVNGYVGSIRFRKGALVSPTNALPLTTVADVSKVYAYFAMNEKDYIDFILDTKGETISDKIKNLPKVALILANGRTYDLEGTIETINSQVDEDTGAITFRAIFENQSRLLTNGNSGKIEIPKEYTNVLVVPKESTFDRQGSKYVYKVGSDSVAKATALRVIDEIGNLYVVNEGVSEGDKIVAIGIDKIKGETKIIPKPVPFDSIAKPIEKVFR